MFVQVPASGPDVGLHYDVVAPATTLQMAWERRDGGGGGMLRKEECRAEATALVYLCSEQIWNTNTFNLLLYF